MPRGWQRFTVYLKGQPDLIVQTESRDFAKIPMDPGAGVSPIDMSYHAVHAALLRMGVEGVPKDYGAFLDELDGFPDLIEDTPADAMDPTAAAR